MPGIGDTYKRRIKIRDGLIWRCWKAGMTYAAISRLIALDAGSVSWACQFVEAEMQRRHLPHVMLRLKERELV